LKRLKYLNLNWSIDVNSQTVSHWCKREFSKKRKAGPLASSAWEALYWFFMTDEEEEHLNSVTASKTVLNSKQAALLEVFDQLPESEQDRFISLAKTRLEELDAFMAEFLRKRKIDPP
jgi:hypothetical protein